MDVQPCQKAIEELAYAIWEFQGRPESSAEANWLLAESALREALKDQSSGLERFLHDQTPTLSQLRGFTFQRCPDLAERIREAMK